MKKVYCLKCDDEQEYVVKKETRRITVKDLTFSVEIKVAFCKKCGDEVFPLEISKENDLLIFDEYRKRKGLLTSAEIKAIRKKRNMSQEDLASFIKCGKKNIARYETGTIQDNVFDYLIRMVGDDGCYFAMKAFEERKDISNFISNSIENVAFTWDFNLLNQYKYNSPKRIGGRINNGNNRIKANKLSTMQC